MIEIRDPIHGFVELSEDEARIVDDSYFQRLRHIHQLAMAYLVYPGTTHSRFEHSLGVCHVAAMLAKRVGLDGDQTRRVRFAALLHDLGHGPFSHVSELAFAACNEALPGGDVETFHERITVRLVRRLHRAGLISRGDLEGIENILVPGALGLAPRGHQRGEGAPPPVRNVCRDIVSGPFDADKMDYLLRDSYYAGVRYGVYDLHRLAHAVALLHDEPNSYLGVKEEDVSAVDQFIIANHNMRVQVYGHRIRRIADLMLVRAAVKAIDEGNEDVARVFTYGEDDEFLDRYVSVDDSELTRLILNGPEGDGKALMLRLAGRHLLKEVLEVPLNRLADTELSERLAKRETERAAASELEARLTQPVEAASAAMVFVEVRRGRPVREVGGAEPVDPSLIMVQLKAGGMRSYDQVSQFFRHGGFEGDDMVSVWGPIDEADRERREVRRSALRSRVLEVLPTEGDNNG